MRSVTEGSADVPFALHGAAPSASVRDIFRSRLTQRWTPSSEAKKKTPEKRFKPKDFSFESMQNAGIVEQLQNLLGGKLTPTQVEKWSVDGVRVYVSFKFPEDWAVGGGGQVMDPSSMTHQTSTFDLFRNKPLLVWRSIRLTNQKHPALYHTPTMVRSVFSFRRSYNRGTHRPFSLMSPPGGISPRRFHFIPSPIHECAMNHDNSDCSHEDEGNTAQLEAARCTRENATHCLLPKDPPTADSTTLPPPAFRMGKRLRLATLSPDDMVEEWVTNPASNPNWLSRQVPPLPLPTTPAALRLQLPLPIGPDERSNSAVQFTSSGRTNRTSAPSAATRGNTAEEGEATPQSPQANTPNAARLRSSTSLSTGLDGVSALPEQRRSTAPMGLMAGVSPSRPAGAITSPDLLRAKTKGVLLRYAHTMVDVLPPPASYTAFKQSRPFPDGARFSDGTLGGCWVARRYRLSLHLATAQLLLDRAHPRLGLLHRTHATRKAILQSRSRRSSGADELPDATSQRTVYAVCALQTPGTVESVTDLRQIADLPDVVGAVAAAALAELGSRAGAQQQRQEKGNRSLFRRVFGCKVNSSEDQPCEESAMALAAAAFNDGSGRVDPHGVLVLNFLDNPHPLVVVTDNRADAEELTTVVAAIDYLRNS